MDIHRLNKILENEKPLMAPSGFTQEVMKKVLDMDHPIIPIKSSSSKIRYLQCGISCLTAGLIVLFLNLYPLLHPMTEANSVNDSISETIDRLVVSTEQIIVDPWSNLIRIFRKEN